MSSLRDELLAIRDKHGYLDPDVVVAEARNKKHPLHDRFEWDNTLAADAYRRDQAHRLIQVVRVPYINNAGAPKDVRAFLAVPREESSRPTYEPVEDVMGDPIARQVVLAQMEREWRALQARYGDLEEFGALILAAASERAA